MDTTAPLDDSMQSPAGDGALAVRWFCDGMAPTQTVVGAARLIIGRGDEVSISLPAAGVSRGHAEIYRQGPACVLHDLGSTNGTHVNGLRVEYASLSEGDVVRFGDAVGVLVRVPAAAAGPAEPDERELAPGLLFGPGLAPQLSELARVAATELPVVVAGETGSGKERMAEALHVLSGRRGPFHAVNCAALPAQLAEAELFGHGKGAFTGADQARIGHVRAAHGGTLFLDELPELPLPLQAKLLRALQAREVTPLGEVRAIKVDVRLVAAAQRAPAELVASGRLRQDLAARLSGLVVVVPPLRARRVDVPILFRHFLALHAKKAPPAVSPRLLERLLLYPWPNNVRELELLAQRLLALHGEAPVLRSSFLPEEIGRLPPAAAPAPSAGTGGDRDEHDRRRYGVALRRHEGNVSRAAAAAGISRARAYRLMGGLSPEAFLARGAPGADQGAESQRVTTADSESRKK